MCSQVNAITCPGFPGYCSESFVGQTCVVVCAAGRPNVPLCQVSLTLGLKRKDICLIHRIWNVLLLSVWIQKNENYFHQHS